MKKFLLLAAAALITVSAGAQTKHYEAKPSVQKYEAKRVVMNDRHVNHVVKQNVKNYPVAQPVRGPKRAGYVEPYYTRPAGTFYGQIFASDGDPGYGLQREDGTWLGPWLAMRPFSDYTFIGHIDEAENDYNTIWAATAAGEEVVAFNQMDFTVNYPTHLFCYDEVPAFVAVDGPIDDENSTWYVYQLTDWEMKLDDKNEPYCTGNGDVAQISTCTTLNLTRPEDQEEEREFILAPRALNRGGRHATEYYTWFSFSGATPYGNNANGQWFGKNGQHFDGIAQAIEKPTYPYLLDRVWWYIDDEAIINGPVNLTCRIYKLDEIPAYSDGDSYASLPEEPGELIATGKASITSELLKENYGYIPFTIWGHDPERPQLEYKFSPTIDCPILIVFDGYNDEGMENLADFTCFIHSDYTSDEGFGEMAYMKTPIRDEEGNFTGRYYWHGLDNFFAETDTTGMRMKTAFSVYITPQFPFLFPEFVPEHEYTFSNEGGLMQTEFEYNDTLYIDESITFWSWLPYEEGDWLITWNGDEELPEWLEIDGEDIIVYDEGTYVNMYVEAEALPEGTSYREATIRFEIPGAYWDYTFKQGEKTNLKGDVNGDGEVNLGDINALIDMVLSGNQDAVGDVDGDGEVTISDINAVIDIILSM